MILSLVLDSVSVCSTDCSFLFDASSQLTWSVLSGDVRDAVSSAHVGDAVSGTDVRDTASGTEGDDPFGTGVDGSACSADSSFLPSEAVLVDLAAWGLDALANESDLCKGLPPSDINASAWTLAAALVVCWFLFLEAGSVVI